MCESEADLIKCPCQNEGNSFQRKRIYKEIIIIRSVASEGENSSGDFFQHIYYIKLSNSQQYGQQHVTLYT
jgi:hypothetical protein